MAAPTEQTPLLSSTDVVDLEALAAGDTKVEAEISTVSAEVLQLVRFGVPTYVTLMLEMSLFATTVVCVGHIGTKELAAASLASTTGNVIAFSWMQGMVCALDTLCAQAWTANPKTTSLHAFRTAVLLTIMMIPQMVAFYHARPILLFLRQDPEVAELAARYLQVLCFSLPAYAYFECMRRWLQAQGLMSVPTMIVSIVAPINILLNYILVWSPEPFGLGFIGAPIAASISTNLMCLGALVYCTFFAPREGWGGFTTDAFRHLGENLKLGLAGVAMTASEWWAFEVLALAVSYLGPEAMAANSVVGTAQFVFYQPALAISIAASVRLGNLLGANRPKQARFVSRIALVMGFVVGFVNMFGVTLGRNYIGRIFTNEPEVLAYVKKVLPVVALYQLADSTAGAAYGVMRGSGQAPMAAGITAISYWVVGIPVSLFAMYKLGYGLVGLWSGVTIGLVLVASGLSLYIVNYLDFEKEAKKAQVRTHEEDATPSAEVAP